MKEKNNQEKKFSLVKMWQDKRLRAILVSSAIILVCALIYIVLLFTVMKEEEKDQNQDGENKEDQKEELNFKNIKDSYSQIG